MNGATGGSPTPPGRATIVVAAEDARVDSTSPTSNFDGSTTLKIRGGSPTKRAYLKFVVTDLTRSPASTTLRLYVTDDSPGVITVQPVTGTWDESTITWDNAPAPSGTVLASGQPQLGWIELDLGRIVNDNGTFAVVLTTFSTNGVQLASRETVNGPHLVLD